MKKLISTVAACAITLSAVSAVCPAVVTYAENPIIQTSFTPDPAPVIFGDELWVFTGRDRNADNDFYYMTGWQAFSTTDMKNWTNHGCFLEDTDYSWCNANDAWASQCIERNGKYYFYFTTTNKSGGGRAVGVGVADNPEGPYKDVLGKPLCGPNWDYIDPTVMIDDDGQAWLMFGNPKCYYVKLKEDMVTLDGEIKSFDMTSAAFGNGKNGTSYGEGPWITKHDNLYYLVYAGFYGSDGGESICYSYGPSVTGPWKFGGKITDESNCFTTHGGTIDYKDHSYLFYHMNGLQGGGSFKRSAAVEEFTYNADGTIPFIKSTKNGPDQLESFDPYRKVEAETGSWFEGLEVEPAGNGSQAVAMVNNGDYIKVSGVDFGDGATGFTASVASAGEGGKIELHLDSATGPIVGTVTVPVTGGWKEWTEVSGNVSGASGEHDLYLRFSGNDGYLFNVDWWQFEGSGSTVTPPEDEIEGAIFHDTFEKNTNSWTGRGGASASTSTNEKYAGNKSLIVTDRDAGWQGATKSLPSSFKAGEEYSFSANVTYTEGADVRNFKLTLEYKDPTTEETVWDEIATGKTSAGQWLQLENTNYKIPTGATNMKLIIETTDDTTENFYIDEVIGAVKGTKIDGPGQPSVKDFLLGDTDFDGRLSALDMVGMRKCVLGKVTDKMTMKNADVDQDGEVNVNDLVLLSQFLLGKIKEFPNNAPIPEIPPYSYDPAVSYREPKGDYLAECSQKGKVINETYTGINGQNKLNVYLPYGYDSSKKYNIFYLMHGGGENENTLFSSDVKMNNILDHMIMNGELEPMIVVTPTFNKCQAETVWDEMKQSVLPFVEGKYSTYAENTTAAGLEASRMHRAYGGFSMGGGSTWNTLINDIDYFGYFMPLSGHCWGGADAIINTVEKSKYKNSTYIFAATGTEDIAYGNMVPQMNALKSSSTFTYTSDFSKGNFYFLEAPGKTHWWGYVRWYVYDALPSFFHEGQ